jgi:2-polyprenyl-3-methyl-5-hydroxy-6-metoxy-1,4-benzoquinol methylase
LPKGSRILDAAGGIGRFSIPLAKEGYKVCLVDACKKNLEVAEKHAKNNGVLENIEHKLADIESMEMLQDKSFDAALAIEAICYCTSPERALSEIKRLVKPGGVIILSVENKIGSILGDGIGQYGIEEILKKGKFGQEGEFYTVYYTEEEFRKMLESAGLEIRLLEGCHYISDGPFDGRLGMNMDIEKGFRKGPTRNLGRAWLAVCEVKK